MNSFGAKSRLEVTGNGYDIFRLDALSDGFPVTRLPYSLKILLENLLRHEDGVAVRGEDIEALAHWTGEPPERELAFAPGRVLMQDFTGVPAIVDLAAMRDRMRELGGDSSRVNPLVPVDLVIDHSVIADVFGVAEAAERNAELEYARNRERYEFLRWGQGAFDHFRVVPPNTGICHQVNLEYLATVVAARDGMAFPDTLVGTDSHTPMVNGLGVLGWGVGGIEAEAAMLGQPLSMLIPRVVGFRLDGELPEGATATDLVLTVAQRLRQHGVVGKFVEFYGPGIAQVPLENRATIGNMSPEYGCTCAIFPIDDETLRYLRFTGRPDEVVALVEAYAKEQGMFADRNTEEPVFSEHIELDLSTVEPSLAGPARPQDRIPLREAKHAFRTALASYLDGRTGPTGPARRPGVPAGVPAGVVETSADAASADSFPASDPPAAMAGVVPEGDRSATTVEDGHEEADPSAASVSVSSRGRTFDLHHGAVVIAAITSCTNTSNPSVMVAAGLLARNAAARGLRSKPWVKTTLAPGSKVVMDYYERAGLLDDLEQLGFYLVGFGCTTCIGNSGPLPPEISQAIEEGGLAVASVLSGNRNFEGRINPDVRMNFLASPPLVVAYALAGSMDVDVYSEPLGEGTDGRPVYLRDIWPSADEVNRVIEQAVTSESYRRTYAEVFTGDDRWQSIGVPGGSEFAWDDSSTYVHRPPFFEAAERDPAPLEDIVGARVLALLGDSVTTDHISPAGVIRRDSPAGRYLQEQGVEPADFNSYGSRRGNHEVMMRGTFANIRLRNRLVPGSEGGVTAHLPDGEVMPIYDAAMRYQAEDVPLLVLAGKEYGSGSSRDWAAKGTRLLGVRAVLAESYERIHRSNLVGMGVLPLQFLPGDSAESLGLTGREVFEVRGVRSLAEADVLPDAVEVRADDRVFRARVRIDTLPELQYFRHGGILPFVMRELLQA